MMKQLALLGYFTSEIGMTQAQRYQSRPAATIRASITSQANQRGPATPEENIPMIRLLALALAALSIGAARQRPVTHRTRSTKAAT